MSEINLEVLNNQYNKIGQRHFPTPVISTQAHTGQAINTFNSEWIDTPYNSPSKSNYFNQDMSATITALNESGKFSLLHDNSAYKQGSDYRYETPPKKADRAFVTPVSEAKSVDSDVGSVRTHVGVKSPEPKTIVRRKVTYVDVLWHMLNTVVGKDKLGKVGQYVLRLLAYHARGMQQFLSDDDVNIRSINKTYSKKINLFWNFTKEPKVFLKAMVILTCSLFSTKAEYMAGALSTFRRFLRFGKTPFRIRELGLKVLKCISLDSKVTLSPIDSSKLQKQFLNRKSLGDLIALYYGINDECLLLFKLKVLTNKSMNKFVSRHEMMAWYYDSMLAMFNAYERVTKFGQQEMDLNIQIQVKKRAKALSKKILGAQALTSLDDMSSEAQKEQKQLQEIHFKKVNSIIDFYKALADIAFNTYSVFEIPLPFGTMQIWMGVIAAVLSTIKVYRESKEKLIKGCNDL